MANPSYDEMRAVCKLLEYEELADGSRRELWLDKNCTWEALWHPRNDRFQPSTYYRKDKYE